ncbi:MAG: hypothetical protein JO148_12405 [Acidimicrobiia bacterium]|nr:hypothetical protein [Acidimicrobiia bacterium]
MDDAHSQPSSHSPAPTSDPVLAAMGGATGALRRFAQHSGEVLAAFDRAAGMRQTGATHRQIAEAEPLFVDFSSRPFRELSDSLSALRRAQARALYEEGMTMAQLGRLLGVTRQRIAVLLGNKRSADG